MSDDTQVAPAVAQESQQSSAKLPKQPRTKKAKAPVAVSSVKSKPVEKGSSHHSDLEVKYARLKRRLQQLEDHIYDDDSGSSSDSVDSDDERKARAYEAQCVKKLKKVKTVKQPLFDDEKTGIWAYQVGEDFKLFPFSQGTIVNTYELVPGEVIKRKFPKYNVYGREIIKRKKTNVKKLDENGQPIVKGLGVSIEFPTMKNVECPTTHVIKQVSHTGKAFRFITEDQVEELKAVGVKVDPKFVLPSSVKTSTAAASSQTSGAELNGQHAEKDNSSS